jgi:hypothetical protein
MNTTIQSLPLEVITQIFQDLPLIEACNLQYECQLFQQALGAKIKSDFYKLCYRLKQEILDSQAKIVSSSLHDDNLRLEIVKLLMYVRYLQTETSLLYASIWRYINNINIWCGLCLKVGEIIEEFNGAIDRLKLNLENNGSLSQSFLNTGLLKWSGFFTNFDDIEEELTTDFSPTPFFIKILDILCCCPSGNFQIEIRRNCNEYAIKSYLQFNNIYPLFSFPEINDEMDQIEKEKIILKVVRDSVKWQNAAFLQDIITQMSVLEIRVTSYFINFQNREDVVHELNQMYTNINYSPYQPVYRYWNKNNDFQVYCRRSTFDRDLTELVCTTYVKSGRRSLPLFLNTLQFDSHDFFESEIIDISESGLDISTLNFEEPHQRSCSQTIRKGKCHFLSLKLLFREDFRYYPSLAKINVSHNNRNERIITYNLTHPTVL